MSTPRFQSKRTQAIAQRLGFRQARPFGNGGNTADLTVFRSTSPASATWRAMSYKMPKGDGQTNLEIPKGSRYEGDLSISEHVSVFTCNSHIQGASERLLSRPKRLEKVTPCTERLRLVSAPFVTAAGRTEDSRTQKRAHVRRMSPARF